MTATAVVGAREGAKIRIGPDFMYPSRGVEPYGTKMKVIGRDYTNSFVLVDMPHARGWAWVPLLLFSVDDLSCLPIRDDVMTTEQATIKEETVTDKPLYPKVKIGAFDYEVKYDDRLEENGQLGRINLTKSTIGIRPDMSPDIERMTLLHEVIHGILFQAGYRDMDERAVDLLAHGLVQVAQDNPELLK